MHRCSTGFFLAITIVIASALPGCLGKGTPNSQNAGVQNVSLRPAGNVSLDVGGTEVFAATATDAFGHTVAGVAQYSVTVPLGTTSPAPLSIASNGNACAGTWDPSVSICSPGTPGIAIVTAVINGVSSPQTFVYVHNHIDNLQITTAEEQQPPFDCFSQGQTWLYQGIAYSQGIDITSTVGPMSWGSTNSGVITATSYVPPNQPNVLNQVKITAESPGITQLFANVSGTTSSTFPITTCLVQYLRVRPQGVNGNSITVNTGTPVTLQATAVDTLGFTLTKPPLTWSTNNPEVVSFSSLTTTTGTNSATTHANLGGADITASCTPPSCNIGIAGSQDKQGRILPGMPVYASSGPLPNGLPPGFGTVSVDVTSTSKPPTYLGWAATDMCGNAPGCVSTMFQITPGTSSNPITATVNVPRTPNSMMFNFSSRLYLGSDQGLMYADIGSGSPTVTEVSQAASPCNVTLCGTVLAISNDGKQAVVSDTVSTTPQVYIYNAGAGTGNNPITDLVLPDVASAAAFSPDLSKIFILTNAGVMYVYSTVDALAPVPIATSGTDVAFSADGSFAYVAGAAGSVGSVSAYSTCALPLPGLPSTELGNPVPTSGIPVQIFPSTNVQVVIQGGQEGQELLSQDILVLEPPPNTPPSNPPVISSVQVLNAQFTQTNIPDGQFTCNPPTLASFVAGPTYDLGQGVITPVYAQLVGDGSQMIIVARHIPAVLIFNVAGGTTTAVPLVANPSSPDPLSASASSDGSQVYVAACDQYPNNDPTQPCSAGTVHVVNTVSLGDYQQVPYINYTTNNMCNNLGGNAPLCITDRVAIRPQ